MSAVSSSYCGANPQTTGFYPFAQEWAKTDSAAKVPSTTASDLLGTQTAASLYYTYAAETAVSDVKEGAAAGTMHSSLRRVLVALLLSLMLFL